MADTCPNCGAEYKPEIEIQELGVHYAKEKCAACHRFRRWIPKPSTDTTKYKRPKAHTDLVKKYSRGFCELCLVNAANLPKGQTLEAQHVIEYQDGGEPTRENIWIVCTACHRFVHWIRTYRGVDAIGERMAKIESGELPISQQEPWEDDGDYLERLTNQRREELGL